jgi:flavin-dependent dehydrogenase
MAPLSTSESSEIVIIGAGPAGAAAATLLAAWGHDVLLIDRAGGGAARLAESIPPSADKVLRAIGVLGAVSDAGFQRWRGNTVWWADEAARVETFADEAAGYQVMRADFDRLLRAQAIDAGVHVLEGRVVEVRFPRTTDDLCTVAVDRGGVLTIFHAHLVIDASGRAGVIARNGLRVADSARPTVAIAGSWQSTSPWLLDDQSHTLVASYAGGWAWSVPVHATVRQFTVMIDPSRSDLVRGSSSREVYLAEIAKVTPFASVLAEANLIDAPWGADASEYTATQYAGDGFLLAGDAGSAINPLSSFGVKKALASGWLAAIAAHTALVNPAMARDAWAFFDRRERAVAAAAARQASRFAIEAAERTGHPFWMVRAEQPGTSAMEFEPDAAALARDPRVLEAFADLRARSGIQLRPGPDVRVEPRAAVRGREIVLEDHLIHASWPDGLRYLRGVDLVALLRLAPEHTDVGALFAANQSAAPLVELPDFLGALSVLLANGTLRHK